MTEKSIKIIHRGVVPVLHTIIWAIGILACFQLFFNHWTLLNKLANGSIFLGVITIYFVYLMEIVLNLMDTALANYKYKLSSSLLYLVAWFIFNIGTTFWLSLLFMNQSLVTEGDNSAKTILYWIVGAAILLKLTDLLFSKNTEFFLHETSESSITTRDI